jgi:hypothetical protein
MTEASPSASPELIGVRCATINRSSLKNRPSPLRANRVIDSNTLPLAAKVQPGDDEYAAIGHTPTVLKKP